MATPKLQFWFGFAHPHCPRLIARRISVKSTGDADNIDTQAGSRIFKTFGEVFADGSLIELVPSANGDQLDLFFFEWRIDCHRAAN
jgi:hypothetical protein